MTVAGRSLELYFIDGRPDGMLTAEVFNWTGHVLRTPRTQLKKALSRPQAGHTGVYILLGEQDGEPLAYIGEAEDLSSRLGTHAARKEWWETAVLITSTANNLHKAHVKYLEARLVEDATSVGMIALENSTVPTRSSLSESDQANMESFLDTVRMVLPAIRIDMFTDQTRDTAKRQSMALSENAEDTGVLFRLETPKHGISGTATLLDGEWIVQAGSKAKAAWTGRRGTSYENLRAELAAKGILKSDGEHAVFQRDYAFSSPSAAAAMLNGRATNGRTAWRETKTGRPYQDWELAQLKTLDSK